LKEAVSVWVIDNVPIKELFKDKSDMIRLINLKQSKVISKKNQKSKKGKKREKNLWE